MYTLYWENMAGSIVVQATLEAIGVPYQLRYVDMDSGEHLSTEFLKENPAGRVPTLGLPEGSSLGETAAIVTLLGERHPDAGVTPKPGDFDRADFLFWLNVMATAGYVTSSRVGHPERFAREDSAIAQVKEQADADFEAFFYLMEHAISGTPYFLPQGLTALDFYLAMLTEWASNREKLLAARPALERLCTAVGETPAYTAAMHTHRNPVSEQATRTST
jgi:glutathione S-transferase